MLRNGETSSQLPLVTRILTSTFRLKSVIGMGTGAGAYILTRFAVSFDVFKHYIHYGSFGA